MSVSEQESSVRTMNVERMVIGEAVALEVAPASVGLRLAGALIDYGLYGLAAWMTLVTWAMVAADSIESLAVLMVHLSVIAVTWMVVVPVVVETVSRGRSAGRLVTGCRVVRDDGGAVRLRHVLVRVGVAVVEVWMTLGVVALISCAATRRSKRLGDLLAGTYVVCERHGAAQAPPLLMPEELADWAANADLGQIPGSTALAARTFIQRASRMDPRARGRLSEELAAQIGAVVAPPPPPGTHPERLVAAVLCEHRDRELRTALADRELEAQVRGRVNALPFQE